MGYHYIDVKRITPNIGAEIRNIDLRELSDDHAEDIRRVLIDRKIIVFRDQILSPYQYADFMRIFGEPGVCCINRTASE